MLEDLNITQNQAQTSAIGLEPIVPWSYKPLSGPIKKYNPILNSLIINHNSHIFVFDFINVSHPLVKIVKPSIPRMHQALPACSLKSLALPSTSFQDFKSLNQQPTQPHEHNSTYQALGQPQCLG